MPIFFANGARLGMSYCELLNINVSLWAWTYEQDGIFVASFDDVDEIFQEFFCHVG